MLLFVSFLVLSITNALRVHRFISSPRDPETVFVGHWWMGVSQERRDCKPTWKVSCSWTWHNRQHDRQQERQRLMSRIVYRKSWTWKPRIILQTLIRWLINFGKLSLYYIPVKIILAYLKQNQINVATMDSNSAKSGFWSNLIWDLI